MVFSSITFLFWFLPLALAVYYAGTWPWWRRGEPPAGAASGRAEPGWELSSALGTWIGNSALLAASLLFYFWGEQKRIYLLFAAIALNYAAGRWLGAPLPDDGPRRRRRRRLILGVAVAANLGLLVYFKYLNFLVGALAAGGVRLDVETVALPLGISFFIFQAMSYTIDVYRGSAPPARGLAAFACYITMFPQLVAGPIVRYCDVASQLRSRTVGGDKLAAGIQRFVVGLAKKVLVANQVALLADKAFALGTDEVTFGAAWIGTLAYTLQIYFDFSGYSDMAIGLGKMFGFEFLENFNYPYVARSVQDFWRRWHISLSTWFRDYLYIPLGGSRGSPVQTYFNLWVVFALCGFWHGASVNFLVWGDVPRAVPGRRAVVPRAGRRSALAGTRLHAAGRDVRVGSVPGRNVGTDARVLEGHAGPGPGPGGRQRTLVLVRPGRAVGAGGRDIVLVAGRSGRAAPVASLLGEAKPVRGRRSRRDARLGVAVGGGARPVPGLRAPAGGGNLQSFHLFPVLT